MTEEDARGSTQMQSFANSSEAFYCNTCFFSFQSNSAYLQNFF